MYKIIRRCNDETNHYILILNKKMSIEASYIKSDLVLRYLVLTDIARN